jgi:hypothetical protein
MAKILQGLNGQEKTRHNVPKLNVDSRDLIRE